MKQTEFYFDEMEIRGNENYSKHLIKEVSRLAVELGKIRQENCQLQVENKALKTALNIWHDNHKALR